MIQLGSTSWEHVGLFEVYKLRYNASESVKPHPLPPTTWMAVHQGIRSSELADYAVKKAKLKKDITDPIVIHREA
ncbi:hypothetical protein KQX54_017129 [Cotesia glomerata]|uniref:Uncharacterized protein n=1 Tax=Cotesia glomerata TaxID=32391 RepID=A0AAV7HKL2_COTGL|nr:hypothetical protein KQX54_017129 [Cotesia glomerata]